MQFMIVFLAILAILSLALIGMAVRLIFINNGEMRSGCAGKNPLFQEEGTACNQCGALPGDVCQDDLPTIEINK